MKKPRAAFYFLAAILALAPVATQASVKAFSNPENGLECAHERVIAYGWTNPAKARAEIGAILRWQYTATTRDKLTTHWHQAGKPWLSCRRIGGEKGHFQCKAAGLPCRIPGGDHVSAAMPPE